MVKYYWSFTQQKEFEEFFDTYNLPNTVQSVILTTIDIMDENYGAGREKEDYGGYIVILMPDELTDVQCEYEKILQKYHMTREWCEFHDKLCVTDAGTYYSDMYIVSSEFVVTIIWLEAERN